jgi:hypothetical protein
MSEDQDHGERKERDHGARQVERPHEALSTPALVAVINVDLATQETAQATHTHTHTRHDTTRLHPKPCVLWCAGLLLWCSIVFCCVFLCMIVWIGECPRVRPIRVLFVCSVARVSVVLVQCIIASSFQACDSTLG